MATTTVYIYSMNRAGEVGAWSRYVFPFHIDNFCQLGDYLYIRADNDVLRVDETTGFDFADDERAIDFQCIVQTPWLDLGAPGVNKQVVGIDVACLNATSLGVQLGTNQNDHNAFTSTIDIPGDTVPGTIIPIPVIAPSLSIRLIFDSLSNWQLQAITAYLVDMRITS